MLILGDENFHAVEVAALLREEARNGGFESYAPLSKWTEAAQFGSQPECENYRHHVSSAGLARNGHSGAMDREAEAKLRLRGICVSSEERKLENE